MINIMLPKLGTYLSFKYQLQNPLPIKHKIRENSPSERKINAEPFEVTLQQIENQIITVLYNDRLASDRPLSSQLNGKSTLSPCISVQS